MARNFIVSAEIVPRTFVISAQIVAVSRPPTRLAQIPHSDLWEEHLKARQDYSKALNVWCESEHLVNLNTERTALACYDSAEYASETAHHVRRSLARAVVGKN